MSNGRQLARTWPYPRHEEFTANLKVAAKQWFRSHQCTVDPADPYRLKDREDWSSNIVLDEVVKHVDGIRQARERAGQGFPLHKSVHDGLSSQALLFNLVGPLVVRHDLEPLYSALELRGLLRPMMSETIQLEYEDRTVFNEDYGQPTSIDLVVGDPQMPGALYIECKLVETEFGGCSVFGHGDCAGSNPASEFSHCYLHHIGRRYWPLLKKHGFLNGRLSSDSTCILANHYQFFREVLFALEKGGVFVLLSDERSPTFSCEGPFGSRGLMPLLLSLTPAELRARVGQASIQDVVRQIVLSGRHAWIGEFKAKYAMADPGI